MLDIRRIRDNRDDVEKALAKRGKPYPLNELFRADEERRALLAEVESMKATRNKVSKEIPVLKKQGGNTDALMNEMKELSSCIQSLDASVGAADEKTQRLLLEIPNTPHESVLPGRDEADNKEIRRFMEPTSFNFEPKPHWDIGTGLGILDFETAAKVTGARFTYAMGLGAKLDRAVANFMLKTHTEKHGYTEVLPPFIAHARSMTGTGQLPKFEEDMFRLSGMDYYLIPTAEVPLTNMYRDCILDGETLPIRVTAHTPLFPGRSGQRGQGHPRTHPSAPVQQGGTGQICFSRNVL